jgi:hypothetical protein
MTTLVFIVAGAALGFMTYALCQFRREEMRLLRHGQTIHRRKAVTVIPASSPVDGENPGCKVGESRRLAAPKSGPSIVRFASTGREHEFVGMRESGATGNLIVLPLGAATPEVKRTAKGRA